MEDLQFYKKPLKFSLQVYHFRRTRRSFYGLLFILLLLLLAYNTFTLFCSHFIFPASTTPEGLSLSPENVIGKSRKVFSLSSPANLVASVMYAMKEEKLGGKSQTHLAISRKNRNFLVFTNTSVVYHPRRKKKHKALVKVKRSKDGQIHFSAKMREFLYPNSSNSSPCKQRFFMTWISSLENFSEREIFVIESLFKSHPNGCLSIVSDAMDSAGGMLFLRPFLNRGFKVMAIPPDYNYLFRNTPAQDFVGQLMDGKVNPGEVSLGQNLSNLLRLGLLYRFGGIYLDTDVIILKSFAKLRNTIGAQSIDLDTKNWSRLNNAVMIFDKGHPLVYKFIEEFSNTFDGSKWGHNGPYLVSRVVARVKELNEYNLTVLSPLAFYPVDWSRIGSLFRGAGGNETRSKWLKGKLGQIQTKSFAVHLWNKQSRKLEVEEGSIIRHLLSDYCLFCNSSSVG